MTRSLGMWHRGFWTVLTVGWSQAFTPSPVPEISVFPGQNLWVGEDLVLSCKIRQSGGLLVWHRSVDTGDELLTHGSTLLAQDDRLSLSLLDSAIYQLRLSNVQMTDSGEYYCQLTEASGDAKSSMQINVFPREEDGPALQQAAGDPNAESLQVAPQSLQPPQATQPAESSGQWIPVPPGAKLQEEGRSSGGGQPVPILLSGRAAVTTAGGWRLLTLTVVIVNTWIHLVVGQV